MQKIEFGVGFLVFMISFSFVIYSLLSFDYEKSEPLEGEVLLETFLKDKGYPENWDSSNVEKIGLALSPNIMDKEKVEELMKMEYKDVKEILKIEGNFRIVLDSENYKFTYGKEIPQLKNVKKFERPIIIDSELGRFYLYYW